MMETTQYNYEFIQIDSMYDWYDLGACYYKINDGNSTSSEDKDNFVKIWKMSDDRVEQPLEDVSVNLFAYHLRKSTSPTTPS